MDYFLENTRADKVFPMHMWEKYEWIGAYKKTLIGHRHEKQIVDIGWPGQEFEEWNI